MNKHYKYSKLSLLMLTLALFLSNISANCTTLPPGPDLMDPALKIPDNEVPDEAIIEFPTPKPKKRHQRRHKSQHTQRHRKIKRSALQIAPHPYTAGRSPVVSGGAYICAS